MSIRNIVVCVHIFLGVHGCSLLFFASVVKGRRVLFEGSGSRELLYQLLVRRFYESDLLGSKLGILVLLEDLLEFLVADELVALDHDLCFFD